MFRHAVVKGAGGAADCANAPPSILNNFQQSGIAPSAENAVKAMHGNSALGGKPFFFELNLALVKRPVFQFIPPRVKRSQFHN